MDFECLMYSKQWVSDESSKYDCNLLQVSSLRWGSHTSPCWTKIYITFEKYGDCMRNNFWCCLKNDWCGYGCDSCYKIVVIVVVKWLW